MSHQLALNVALADTASFDNFYFVDRNRELQDALTRLHSGDRVFYHGECGAGKTHLACAVLRKWRSHGRSGQQWVPGTVVDDPGGLVVIDDTQTLVSQPELERELFNLYESVAASGGTLLMAGDKPPGFMAWRLADLASRLTSSRIYHLLPLVDADLPAALRLRARNRGFELPSDVIDYILRRYRRDGASLFGLLDIIDAESLAAGRKVTVPFMRDLEQQLMR